MKRVGIVGTGTMGCTVAAKWIENGVAVAGFDAYPACIERGKNTGIIMYDSLAELAKNSDWVILFLPGPKEIAVCVTGENGLLANLASKSIIIDMCTSAPENTQAMECAAKKKNIAYLDAPVLGRPVTVGKWALPVGGCENALEEVRPLLCQIAAHVERIGDSGAGHKVKLLNQLMFGAINSMTGEMMALAEKLGVPPAKLYQIITASQAGTVSNLFKELGSRVSEARYTDPTFTMALLMKDVRLGVEMAESAGAPLLIGRTIDYLNRTACAQGYGQDDTSVLWQCLKGFWQKKNIS